MQRKCDTLGVVEAPPTDIRVTGAEVTYPDDKIVYPLGGFDFKVNVHNYGDIEGDVKVKLTYNGTEVDGSPITIRDVPAGGDTSKTVSTIAPSITGIFDMCAKELL